ncbi:MAG: diaminopimelate decarboxylase [Alphaproteobacteria bacterium]|nr:diaminopimelate decarboxylase [Alphaproteobacteria bacterium]
MFISNDRAFDLIEKYGSPLYVYDENILRERCREIRNLLPNKNYRVNYSAKANSNLELLKIVLSEDIDVDAMSPGEIFVEQEAGFPKERILYIGNNVSADEMTYAIERGVLVSVDSLSQLELFGKINRGGRVAVRFNAGVGAGHHEKVVTAGKKTKFGVQKDFIGHVKELIQKYDLKLVGINQHIGSLFLDGDKYIDGVKNLLEIAHEFRGLDFIDMGGGFGVPYKEDEHRLDLAELSRKLDAVFSAFIEKYDNKNIMFKSEPGRYIVAECGMLLGEVYSVKENYGIKYVGTDLGFNVLARPVMYDSYHQIRVAQKKASSGGNEKATIVGNICESGDIIAKDRVLPPIGEGDIIAVMNAGAYGFSMSSNYNCRLKPAEVLISSDGKDRLIRRRDSFEDIMRNFV